MMTRILAVFFGVLGHLTPAEHGQELLSVSREFSALARPRQAMPPKRS
jgi:hypothetical protein